MDQPTPDTKNLPIYTRNQLALRNGQDKPQIWIALNGIIYDVTTSRLWRDGKHYEHWAGQDLTHELKDAPHTENVFDKFKPIGRLKQEEAKS
jgi:predicted heme/steroid binding protein